MSARLGESPLVDVADIRVAMDQVWFDTSEFRAQYVSGLPKALSDDAAEAFIRTQLAEFDSEVKEETGSRMMAMLELCEMALRHGITALAVELCRTTWELALGYAQRKDPALSEVMDALEYLAPHAPDEARRLLGEVSPQINKVTAFTDGKGTRHVTAHADDLLATLDRKALVEKCREHAEKGDWSEAENSLRAFLRTAKTESVFTSAVLRTGVHLEAVSSLRAAAHSGDAVAVAMSAEVEQHRGSDVGRIDEQSSKGSGTDFAPFAGDVKTYPIADLQRLLVDLRDLYGVRGDVLCEWYRYWESQGQGSQLIAALEPVLLSEACRDNDMSELLDLAFATKLRLEGSAKAFHYTVQAQLYRGGWLGNMERLDKTEARLAQVVKTYRRRCDEFFRKSAFSWLDRQKQNRVIPSDIMVYFLGLQGRTAEAVEFVETMVRCVQEDTRTLRLSAPLWALPLPDVNVELELLMTRLRWPVASTRWWAMQELATLLLSPATQAEVCQRLLQELRTSRLEAETVELLSVFWMAFKRGWVVAPELANEVQQPSLLAVRLLVDMGQKVTSNRALPLQLAPSNFEVPASFKRVQGADVPRIYLTLMGHLEKTSGRPFVSQFAFEWSESAAAYPDAPHPGDLVYFVRLAGDRGTASFASRVLLRMLTAFQRTLAVAVAFWRMPESAAYEWARYALPLEPTIAFMQPSRPTWVPQLGRSSVIDQAVITEFIYEARLNLTATKPEAVLLAMATPIVITALEIIELSVVRWRKWGTGSVDADSFASRARTHQWDGAYGDFDARAWGTRSRLSSPDLVAVLDEDTQAAPMAAIHNVERVGYLQKDLYPNRLYLPVITGKQEVDVAPRGGELLVSIAGKKYATSAYWNAGWSPGHPAEIGGFCGTGLVAEGEATPVPSEPLADQYFYFWTVTRLSRPSEYGAYEEAPAVHGVLML